MRRGPARVALAAPHTLDAGLLAHRNEALPLATVLSLARVTGRLTLCLPLAGVGPVTLHLDKISAVLRYRGCTSQEQRCRCDGETRQAHVLIHNCRRLRK